MKATSICFIANYEKTYFFDRVAQALIGNYHSYEIFWVTVNVHICHFLKGKYSSNNVLYLLKEISKTKEVGEYKLNELVYGDRILRGRALEGIAFLESIQRPILDFIEANNIKCIFGELTWAHEILIHRMCTRHTQLGCTFLNPHTIRIPNGRFAFFYDEYQSIIKTTRAIDHNLTICLDKPDYVELNNRLAADREKYLSRLNMLYKFIFSKGNYYDANDPTLYSKKYSKLINYVIRFLNRHAYNTLDKISLSALDGKKYILYALHKQPEASIDTFGRYYEDQLSIIRNLWRILPADWLLVVKDHSNAIGDRGRSFYKSILAYPRVHLISEHENSIDVVKGCQAVFTVSGTIAYEAALLGKINFTFAPAFFNHFSSSHRVTVEDIRCMESLESYIQQKLDLINDATDRKVCSYLMSSSFPGIISDPISNPQSISENNIDLVARAFDDVINAGL